MPSAGGCASLRIGLRSGSASTARTPKTPIMARSTLLAALILSLLAVGVSGGYPSAAKPRAQRATCSPTFVISGRGWGHGVGMAQWGAYGFAKHGFTYDKILAHYYPGTTLAPSPVSKIKVLLVEGATSVVVSSPDP